MVDLSLSLVHASAPHPFFFFSAFSLYTHFSSPVGGCARMCLSTLAILNLL
jgi:hypothetical protein